MGRIIHLVPKSGSRPGTGPMFSFAAFTTGGKKFAVRPEKIDEITAGHPILSIPQKSPWLTGVVNMRGRVVPVFDLRRRLGLEGMSDPQSGCILIFSVDRHYVGMIVESIEETLREAVGNPVPATPGIWPAFISSVIPTSDGEFGLIDPERILTAGEREEIGTIKEQF
ncbi:MAG: chemotaxis protein CheW [Candidatus Riflebacteria bacterium]|nr:chemotaxis protein CheW [Candidatus Riflebacteria bacterium]